MKNNLVVSERFRAMGTEVNIDIVLDREEKRKEAEETIQKARSIFAEQEKIFSRFDPESELSRINQNVGKEMTISKPMKEMLRLCLKFNKLMAGYFDPRVLDNLEKIGYDRDFQKNDLNSQEEEIPSLDVFSHNLDEELKINYTKNTVLISRRMDTTGIAKGYTVDKVAEYLQSEGWQHFWVDAGGDMFALGKRENNYSWLVGVEGLENDAVRIKLENEGLATSGISRKRWTRGNQKVHHLINPLSPDEFSHDLKTVTVVAEKTVEADGRAKSLFLMGREKGLEFANKNNIKCLFLDYKNNIYVSEKFKENLA